jgi:virginiamycin B lyase
MSRSVGGRSARLASAIAIVVSIAAFVSAAASSPALAARGHLKEFVIPGNTPGPQDIAVGSDGALWFTEINLGIGRLGRDGTFSNFSLSQGAQPLAIASGSDGALWATETYDDSIARLTTSGKLHEFLLCDSGCGEDQIGPWDITAGPDGALWFTEYEADAIGRITTSGQLTTFPLSGGMQSPLGITVGPDGALWFTDSGGIGRITTDGDVTQEATSSGAYSITTGPDGNLWFTNFTGVGRLTPAGHLTNFQVPENCYAQDISSGLGALWFGCYYLDEVDRMTTSGAVTVFPIPHHFPDYPDGVQGIVQGPGANVMSFVEYAAERVGRLQP